MISTFPNIIAFAFICVLLLIGTILRTKIRFFQTNLVPASLIGGVIGFLLLTFFGHFMGESYNYAAFTFHFFTLSFMSLCLTGMPRSGDAGHSVAQGGLWLTFIWAMSLVLQALIGLSVIVLFNVLTGGSVSEYLGIISTHGFTQGPGQALAVGNIWEAEFGIANAANVGLIFASIGFVIAFIVGIPVARWAIQRGVNTNKSASITPEFLSGIFNRNHKEVAGYQITHPSNVDSLAYHIAILGLAYLITHVWLTVMQPVAGQFSGGGIRFDILFSHNLFFVHGLIVCIIIRAIMDRSGLGYLIDDDTQKRITGSSVDFMVVATLLSVKFTILLEFLAPILLVTIAITLITAILCFGLGRYLNNLSLERALTIFGCCTGSTGSGLLLLRLVDPDYTTPVSRELAFFNVAIVVVTFHIWAIVSPVLPSYSLLTFGWIYAGTFLLMLVGILVLNGFAKKRAR